MKILILCTGYSCRSQMAQGFLQSFDKRNQVFSAGTFPASMVNPDAIRVMTEVGIDIGQNIPKSVNQYLNDDWDYVITVCDYANESCPYFQGKVKHRLHLGFQDPSNAMGSEEFIISEFRKIRDQIKTTFYKFYNDFLI